MTHTTEATPTQPKTAPSRQTKKQLLIDKLRPKTGADLATLATATGWQRHTVRAALSRLKAEGYALAREPGVDGKPARYRVTEAPPEDGEPQTETEERDAATHERKKPAGKKPAQKKIARKAATTSAGRGKADAGNAA